MADLYSTTVASTTFGANARRAVVSYPTNYNGTPVAASPYSQFGTRELTLLKATAGSGTPFATSTLDDAGSDFALALQALSSYGEVFYVTRVSDTVIAFFLAEDTRNGAEANSNVQATTYGALEAALGATVSGGLTFTVAAASIS